MFWCMLELVWKWGWKTCCRSLSTALLLITCVTFLIEKKSYTTLWSWFLLPQFSIRFIHPNPHPFFLHLWNKKASKTPNKPDFYKKIRKNTTHACKKYIKTQIWKTYYTYKRQEFPNTAIWDKCLKILLLSLCLWAIHCWIWGLTLSLVNISSETPLVKTSFSFMGFF